MREFLNNCQKIEIIAGEIYRRLASNTTYASKAIDTFQKLSSDEQAHARLIDMVAQSPEHELAAAGRFSWEIIADTLQLAEEMIKTIKSRELSEEEALRLAIKMEQQFIKVHINESIHFYNKRLDDLFTDLGSEDQKHLDRLRACLVWWHSQRTPLKS